MKILEVPKGLLGELFVYPYTCSEYTEFIVGSEVLTEKVLVEESRVINGGGAAPEANLWV